MADRRIQGFGWKRDIPDHRDRLYHLDETVLRAAQLPAKFSLRDEMPPVYDQGQLGSCTANAIGAVLEHREMQESEGAHTPSRLFIYYGEREIEGTIPEDAGAEIRDGIKVVAKEGAPPEELWPYDISKFADKPSPAAYAAARKHEALDYKRIEPLGIGAPIRTALSRKLPIANGFPVPSYFEEGWDPKTEALPLPDASTNWIGGHAVTAIGWDFTKTRFPVNVIEERNSWSADWGDEGYFFVHADWYKPGASLFSDLWVISRTT